MTKPCQHTTKDVATLIKSMGKDIVRAGPQKADAINEIEGLFGLKLPSDYRQFLGNYGALQGPGFAILGLGDLEETGIPVVNLLFTLRMVRPDFPLELVPIEARGKEQYACLATNAEKNTHCPVVELDLAKVQTVDALPQLAPCFLDYLYDRLSILNTQDDKQDAVWTVFEQHVRKYQAKFAYNHDEGGKLPRNHEWRPYRYCIQDVVFGITVVRHMRQANCLLVDVFLTAKIPEYDPLAGALALTTFLLSEAYKCGGTMEIRFTHKVEGKQVPHELQALAARYNVPFEQADEGRVLPAEAKALYATLTEFSPEFQEKIHALEQAGKIKMARVCFVVNHGIWTKEQVEMIVLGSELPDVVLSGRAQPIQRHLYAHALFHARAALLGGMLDRILAKRERATEEGTEYDLEDDVRPLDIDFDGAFYAKQYHSKEPMPVPWLYLEEQQREIPAGVGFNVCVRARDAAELRFHLPGDIQQASNKRAQSGQPTLILVPNDFTSLPEYFRQQILEKTRTAKVGLLVCPESVLNFDSDAAQRLARSRILRQ